MTFKQKVENFWYYNKWFVIVGGIFAIFFIIAFVQIITKVESDVDIMYVGPSQVASANVEDMQENISAVVKRDFNDDGEIFVKIISYKVYTGESNGEFDAFQKGEIEGYTTELIAGDSTILLLDPVIYEGLKKDGIIIVNDCRIDPMTVVIGAKEYPKNLIEELTKNHTVIAIDGAKIAKEIGNSKVLNTVVLGVAAKHIGFDKETWLETVRKTVPQKTVEINEKAFLSGYDK